MLLHSKTIIYPVRFNQVKLVRFILVKVSAHIYSFLPSVTNQVKLVHLTGNSPPQPADFCLRKTCNVLFENSL